MHAVCACCGFRCSSMLCFLHIKCACWMAVFLIPEEGDTTLIVLIKEGVTSKLPPLSPEWGVSRRSAYNEMTQSNGSHYDWHCLLAVSVHTLAHTSGRWRVEWQNERLVWRHDRQHNASISGQKIWGNSVLGAVFSFIMPKNGFLAFPSF